jgi:hypothetical protein
VSLKDRLAEPPAKRVNKSALDVWYDELPEDEQAVVLAAVLDRAWGHVQLRDALAEEGAPFLSDNTFGVWRRKMGWTA